MTGILSSSATSIAKAIIPSAMIHVGGWLPLLTLVLTKRNNRVFELRLALILKPS